MGTYEKGRVERAIGFIRRAFFAARKFTDLADLNTQARSWCQAAALERPWPEDHAHSVRQAFERERDNLMQLPEHEFALGERVTADVGKTPYVRFDLNDYTVPPSHVRRTVSVLAEEHWVRIFDGATQLAEHVRCWDSGRQIEDPSHIQALLEHKARGRAHRAVDHLARAVPAVTELLTRAARRGENLGTITAALLRLLDRYGPEPLQAAVGEALARDVPHPNAVRLALERARHEQGLPPPTALCLSEEAARRDAPVPTHSLDSYDRIYQLPPQGPADADPRDDNDDEQAAGR